MIHERGWRMRYLKKINRTDAGAIIVPRTFEYAAKTLIRVDNPQVAFAKVLEFFYPPVKTKIGTSSKAFIGENFVFGDQVSIAPFVVIQNNVSLGDRVTIHPNVTIGDNVTIGSDVLIYPNVTIGAAPQDLKYDGGPTKTIVGDFNIFRENVTVHRGTENGGGETVIGNHNLFMIGCHIAHDCILSDHIIMANQVHLAGQLRHADILHDGDLFWHRICFLQVFFLGLG